MLHSSCLSALASISSSVTRMIKTSLKHLSQGQNTGGEGQVVLEWWSSSEEEAEPTSLFVFLTSKHVSLLRLVSKTSAVSEIPSLGSPVAAAQ